MQQQPAAAPAEEVNPELAKQQAQLADFNEYIHKCRDMYKAHPTQVSVSAAIAP